MAALTKDRNTPEAEGKFLVAKLAAGAKVFAGAIVCRNAAGFAVPASTALNLKVLGRAEETVDNAAGVAGDKSVRVRRGVYRWENSAAGEAIAAADIGNDAYLVDDQTVAKTNGAGTRSAAGKIVDVDALGVWVETGR